MKNKTQILYLWSDLSGYLFGTINKLIYNFNCNVSVIHWGNNYVNVDKNVYLYKKNIYNNKSLFDFIVNYQPDIIVISGWMDKDYIKVAKKYKKNNHSVNIVFGLDNQWHGSLRQYIGIIYFRIFFRKLVDFLWVSGKPQFSFAQRLGFSITNIIPNLYSADTDNFTPNNNFTKRFVFVGRFISIKGIELLIDSYLSLPIIIQKEWPLILIGDGVLAEKFNNYIYNENIRIISHLQPKDLKMELLKGGVGCLPSYYEPWGVVIHEFTRLGYPLILSDICGAHTEFLIPGYNGFLFAKGNKSKLTNILLKFTEMPINEILEFSKSSIILSNKITSELSAASLISIIHR